MKTLTQQRFVAALTRRIRVSPFLFLGIMLPGCSGACTSEKKIDVKIIEQRGAIDIPVSRPTCIAFSPDGKSLALAPEFGFGSVQMWDLVNNNRRVTFSTISIHTGLLPHVSSVAFSPDGKMLATSDIDKDYVKFWDIATGKQTTLISSKKNVTLVSGLAYSPNGRLLAGTGGKGIWIWDLAEKRVCFFFDRHVLKADPRKVCFSSDSRLLASGGSNKGGGSEILVWDIDNKKELFKAFCQEARSISSVAFFDENKKLMVGTDYGCAFVFDITTREKKKISFAGSNANSNGYCLATVSNDCKTIAVAGTEYVQLWDVASKSVQAAIATNGWVRRMRFSPDDKYIAADLDHKSVIIWKVQNPD